MKKTFIKEIEPHIELHRCPTTGVAWVENGKTGTGHSAHPNIDTSGDIAGMKKLGYWKEDAVTVETHRAIYNVSIVYTSDKYDEIAKEYCRCVGCLIRNQSANHL